jgi:hypothetical protein
MIVFDLKCSRNHRFEGWFASGEDFESQRRNGLLECPSCGTADVTKLLTAKIRKSEAEVDPKPQTSTRTSTASKPEANVAAVDPREMMAFIDHILARTEDVGARFVEEARKINRKEAPERSIRGKASATEVEELLDEGIFVLPLPVPPQEEWH